MINLFILLATETEIEHPSHLNFWKPGTYSHSFFSLWCLIITINTFLLRASQLSITQPHVFHIRKHWELPGGFRLWFWMVASICPVWAVWSAHSQMGEAGVAGVWASSSVLRLLGVLTNNRLLRPPGGFGLVSISSMDIRKLMFLTSVPQEVLVGSYQWLKKRCL